ncbi:S49 family peptidase [Pararhizobium sp. O133]|uniref:S49 family peptidase n=1 Tax=Pararhizobium sp. O133 TaxID=3449278 RepID=UPI003F685591
MSFAYGNVAQRLFDTPLMYDERKAETFVRALGSRITGSTILVANGSGGIDHTAFENGRPSAGKLGDRLNRAYQRSDRLPFDIIDNVAIIPIEGTLIHKGAFIGSESGETSYQGLQTQIATAIRSPAVKGVVFEVDSYGGEVSGSYETATLMQELSKAKPTISILTDFAYSSGYLLASQARQIVIPEFGGAGSIGVIILHADYSDALAQEGVKVTIIRSGKFKFEGNSLEPLPERVIAKWQAQTDAIRDKFATFVSRGRSGRITKAKALATEAECFDANEAIGLGLVDVVGDPVQAFNAFIKEVNRS